MNCQKCGTRLLEDEKYCHNCGQQQSTIQQCKSCGTEMPAGYRFCPNCGFDIMAVCARCGKPLPQNAQYCEECGASVSGGEKSNSLPAAEKESKPIGAFSNKWAWWLAFTPLIIMVVFTIVPVSAWLSATVGYLLYCVLVCLDINELKKANIKTSSWSLWGFAIVPAYMFVRAYKTNKKYGPAITLLVIWLPLFLFFLIMRF